MFYLGYVKSNQPDKAIDLFKEIKEPDDVIYILLCNACAQLKSDEGLSLVKTIAKKIHKAFYSNPRLQTSLLDAFIKCSDMAYAQSVFNSLTNKNIEMYGAMINGNTFIYMVLKIQLLFYLGYFKSNQPDKAIGLFKEIKEPNDVIYILLCHACAQLKSDEGLSLIKTIAKDIPKSFYSNPRLQTSLIDAFAKCGDIVSAQTVFNSSKNKNIEMYGALMNGYNKEDSPQTTLDLFDELKANGNEKNIVVFLCVIKALAKLGDYSLSESIIEQIPNSFLIDKQLQAALIDMWVCIENKVSFHIFSHGKKQNILF